MFRVIIGGFIGAVIAFAWSFVSWTVLPWHDYAIDPFKNQDFVSWVIKENVPKSGVYMAPFLKSTGVNLTPAEMEQNAEEQQEAMKKGPIIFAQVHLEGSNPYGIHLLIASFLTQFAGAIFICWLLRQAADMSYGGRLLFVMVIGLVVGILGYLPGWTWFGAGWKYTSIMIADLVATWFLAGLFLAAFIKDTEIPDRELMM